MDIVSEILSRASLQTVASSRLVSKECNRLTYESWFRNLNSERAKTTYGYFLQRIVWGKYSSQFVSSCNSPYSQLSLDFLPFPDVKILASFTEGLMLCVNTNPKHHWIPEYYVCKASTQQYQKIPNPKTRFTTKTIVMRVVSLTPVLRYRILRFSEHSIHRKPNFKFYGIYDSFRAEMFDSDTWKWRELEDVYLPNGELLSSRPRNRVSVCGIYYWLTTENNIFYYNDREETWGIFSLPEDVGKIGCLESLVKYEGKLGVVCREKEPSNLMHVVVMEDHVERKWSLRFSVDLQPLRVEEPYLPSFVGFVGSDKILMHSNPCKLIIFDVNAGCFEKLKVKHCIDPDDVFAVEAGLEKVDLMGPYENYRKKISKMQEKPSTIQCLDILVYGLIFIAYFVRLFFF